jgi:hypothetical protein
MTFPIKIVIFFQFLCCGASSYRDWEYNLYYNCSSPSQMRCGVPPSCCKQGIEAVAASAYAQCGFQARIEGVRITNINQAFNIAFLIHRTFMPLIPFTPRVALNL